MKIIDERTANEPASYDRRDEPFFAKHPDMFMSWMLDPTENAKRAVKFWQNRENFEVCSTKPKHKPMPLKASLIHWFMIKILRWKFIPASVMHGSPVFQAVLKDLDSRKDLK